MFCISGKDKDLVIHNQQKNITIIGWSSNDKFEEVQHVIGNEHVVLQITGKFSLKCYYKSYLCALKNSIV